MTTTNEVVLFHVHDPAPALHFTDIPNETLFDLCVRSIRAQSPESRITLLTDAATDIGNAYPDVTTLRDPGLRTEYLMYERSRLYGEHVARRVAEPDALPLTFMDIDILVNRDLGEVFAHNFDVGLTCRAQPGIALDANGIPTNTQVSPINGGVIFAKPTPAANAFFTEHMARYDALHANATIPNTMVADIRKWGGDQFALMNMVGKTMLEQRSPLIEHQGAKVRFFDCDTYNFTPEDGMDLTAELLAPKYILHMKGPRKKLMPALAQWMGIP